MKTIQLGGKRNLSALVDDEDFDRASKFKWSPVKSTVKSNGQLSTFYAQSVARPLMHRFILGISDPSIEVDHINRNGLDNRKSNLRTGTKSQNRANRPKARKNSSGFKGVYQRKNSWTAIISLNDKLRHIGTFKTKQEAAAAYDNAAFQQWGEFAWLNFPKSGIASEGAIT